MEKLKLKKEQRCILQSQADIIQNARKAMKELEVEKDLLKEEKKKLENEQRKQAAERLQGLESAHTDLALKAAGADRLA